MDLQTLLKAFYLLLCLPGLLSAENIRLPDMGDSAGAFISPEQEHRIGTEFLRRIRLSFQLIEDPEITEYIRNLGNRVAANSDDPVQNYTFFMLDDPRINAFAAPGGFIGINTGLFSATESESELASVIAHEIAHITQRHMARAYEAQSNLNLPALAGVIAAIIIGSQNSELGRATLSASQAAAVQAQLDFTRSNENEADHIGIQTLAAADFDPRAMTVFFERLQQASRYYSRPPEFLSTHPVTVTRIANARGRAERYPFKQFTDSLDYHLIREKIRQYIPKQPHDIAYYEKVLASRQYNNETATRYGYALALAAAGRFNQADQELLKLLKQHPEQPYFLLARAQFMLESGKTQAAVDAFQQALKLYPGDHSLTVTYARALLQLKRAAESRQLLHEHRRQRDPDASLYHLLAIAEDAAGFPLEAHQSLAEYHYLNGQTREAIRQLDIALALKTENFIELSKIQARRDQLRQLEREENPH
ncbi:M48 family metalloprotease [Sulfuriflexus mobilis]|uniref:beta-barrel assembly-enhancing protease n=1 Tax=Sulfuriflexus mobilis TaxID=1811807 RepID=UPI000F8344BD|nr:M48 family metalloprotease [Sulfuriflexus mobilis]